ncbi:alpha/beta-hydrolase [Biscogniauxia mediterranea]|nr:alpha/beta-hydrolase [Biscogniauxia mediterranea]
MAAASDLAVVICHGSYHTPAPYTPLVEALRSRGIEAHCPQLRSSDLSKMNVGDVNNPDFNLGPPAGGYPQGEEDLKVVLGVLNPVVDRGKRVILLAHSSGGWVATEAARPELQAKHRKASGLPGGIIGILYMGAFIIPVGESVHSFFQPKDGSFVTPPFMKFHKHGGAGLGTIAQKWAQTLTASPVLTTKLTNDAYSNLPCAYLVLDRDLTLPREYQEGMAVAQGEKTGAFTMYHCSSGHSPHLSRTEEVVSTIQDFAEKINV